jgi:hypothetical protein
MIVWLASVEDADVYEHVVASHPGDFVPGATAAFLGVSKMIAGLLSTYRYAACPEFLNLTSGKSAAFRAMKEKIEMEPQRHRKHREQFIDALRKLPESNRVYSLLDPELHPVLDELALRVSIAKGKAN